MKMIVKLFIYAGALFIIARCVPNISVTNFWAALLVALVWGIMSVTLRPILTLLTLPINLLTLGLFTFILNALLFWLLTILPGFSVGGFLPALEGSVLLTLVGWVLHAVL